MRLLTAVEVASILQLPKSSVYELIRLKRLPSVHIGRLVRVPEECLRAWIATGGSPLTDEAKEEPPLRVPNLRAIVPSRR